MRGWTRPSQGVLFVVSGPSGVGKSTLIASVMRELPDLGFSVSATTRAPRTGEREGVDYHFLDQARFDELVEQDAFLEWARVYDRCYGTLAGSVREAIAAGRSIVLDIDVQGARQVRRSMPESVQIMVVPPDLDVLEARLRARATEAADVVERRMRQVAEQLGAVAEFEYVVENVELDTANRVFQGIFLAEMSRLGRRRNVVERVESQLAGRRV